MGQTVVQFLCGNGRHWASLMPKAGDFLTLYEHGLDVARKSNTRIYPFN
jgi:hypothetical protein